MTLVFLRPKLEAAYAMKAGCRLDPQDVVNLCHWLGMVKEKSENEHYRPLDPPKPGEGFGGRR